MQDDLKNNIASKSKKEKASFTKGFIEQLELVVIFFAILILVFSFMCKSCMVDGDSMLNTLHHQERVIVWNLFYKPACGDIVVIHDNKNLNKPIVKRIIGLPGDTVFVEHSIDAMTVTVTHSDGTSNVLTEEYIRYDLNGGSLSYYPPMATYKVDEGEVFVMGDNRLNSVDSRLEGCYDTRQILGKVIFRMTPFDKMGTVK